MIRPTFLLLAAAVAAACTTSAKPTAPAPGTALVARAGSDSAPAGVTAPPTVRVEGRTLVVLGLIDTPTPCYVIAPVFTVNAMHVVARIRATAQGEACIQVLGQFAYRAERELEPGTYTVRVVHEYPGTGWPTTEVVVEGVTVP